ncbi:MAG: MFS transporter [Chloroflexota bacterium]
MDWRKARRQVEQTKAIASTGEHESGNLRPRAVLALISGVTFLSFLDNNLLIPVVALYASELGASTGITGLIVGMYSIFNAPANLVSGRFMDRVGYKVIVIAGLVTSAASMFSYSLARLPLHLGLVRAFHGIGGGLTSPATMSAVAEHCRETQRGRAMGFYGISLAMANLVGFVLSGVIVSRLGYPALFRFGTIMLAVGLTLSLWLPAPGKREAGLGKTTVGPGFRRLKGLLLRKGLAVSYSAIFAQYFAFGGVATLLPLYVRGLGMDAFRVGMIMTAFTGMFIVLQFPSGVISDKVGRVIPVAVGLGLGIFSLLILSSVTTFLLLIAAMASYGVAFGILFPSVSALVGDCSSPGERGLATGIFHGLLTAGVATGAIVLGWVGETTDIRQGLQMTPAIMVPAMALALAAAKRG